MGRPRKKIDPKQVETLASLGLSYAEIGSVVDCDPSTLTRRFAQVIKKGHERCNASLRRKQFEEAMKGNTSLLIFLGKNRLGQSDKPQGEVEDGALQKATSTMRALSKQLEENGRS